MSDRPTQSALLTTDPAAQPQPTIHAWLKKRAVRTSILGLALLLVTIVIPLYAYKVANKTDYTDFEVYYRAATRAKLGQWDQIYNMGDGASPFRYAPPLLPFFRPFAELTLSYARMAWYFIQVAWFALSFWFLSQALRLTRVGHGRAGAHAAPSDMPPEARKSPTTNRAPAQHWVITAFAFLFVLRFCLDCFTIGQVSSLLFLGYSAALWAWMARRPGTTGSALLVPSAFKIGPGFLFSLLACAPKKGERERALGMPLLCLAVASLFVRFWAGGWATFKRLWLDWVEIVANDSVYYDASHYGSQSIKSACLRAVKAGWLTASQAQGIHLTIVVSGCLALLVFWWVRRPRGPLGRGAFFALGIFPYLWFMPETFKYSLTTLAIPAALLLAQPKPSRLSLFALTSGILTLSLAGLDVIGTRLFFGLQYASVPLITTLFLGAATLELALKQSRLMGALDSRSGAAPWPITPTEKPERAITLLVPLPMQSVSTLHASWLRGLLSRIEKTLSESGESFEILLVPFGNRASQYHPAWREADRWSQESPKEQGANGAPAGDMSFTRKLLPVSTLPERGSALRDGFLASSGRMIFCVNAEQPCEPEFYLRALDLLRSQQADLVRANRRAPESRFRVSVRYLKIVYGRHRLGLLFNRFVRLWLPIQTTDTHSGSWAMTREVATAVFALQKSSGFLFELEAWIVASTHGFLGRDLPVTLLLSQEKTARRVGHEAWGILRGIPALCLRHWAGRYAPKRSSPRQITADDWGITPGVNLGILELARLGIVRRVSLMAYGGYLTDSLPELQALRVSRDLSLGLHFDLTYGKAGPGSVLKEWVLARVTGNSKKLTKLAEEARTELKQQLQLLSQAGVKPTHLDGHHHIHLVPGMLDVLAPLIRESGIRAVRLPDDPALKWRKPALWLLTQQAKRAFIRHGFETMACVYPHERHFKDQGWLRALLRRTPNAEVIVHPASVDDLQKLGIPDPYTSGRLTEYQALRMLAFELEPRGGARS